MKFVHREIRHPLAAAILLGVAALAPPTGFADDASTAVGRDDSASSRGWRHLLSKPYADPTLTEAQFNELWKTWPEQLRAEAQRATPAQRRRLGFSRYGMIADHEGSRTAPLGFAEDGKGGWVLNCLACHQGKVAGRVIPGVPNSHFAFQTLANDLLALRRLKGEQPTMADLSLAFGSLGRTNGTTNAQIFSVALVAKRDNDLEVVPDNPYPPMVNHDLDAPPLWNTKRKHRLYIDGFPEKTSRVIMQFVLTPTNGGAAIRAWEHDFEEVLAWIESLEPPKYAGDIDHKLAERGQALFEQTCARCHGTYGADGKYPEQMVEIADVGTDPLRLTGMPVEHRRFFKGSWFGEYGQRTVVEEPKGYIAPPLNGVWASAPYFHNGSVPTLWHVLHPDQRPQIWKRTEDGYDTQKVGLEVTQFEQLPAEAAKRPDERRTYFDTAIPGKSAAGHEYPNELSSEEKLAVLEYLKTL